MILLITVIMAGCKSNSTGPNYSSGYGNNNTGGGTTPPANQVWMQNTSFNSSSKTITAGTEITWVNKDAYNHTVTSGTPGHPDGKFDSGIIASGGTYTHKFTSTGTFNYYCTIHQALMTGTIIVR
jgi:plastocyanin